jgi:steroid 5-alpha reductase family enzyme
MTFLHVWLYTLPVILVMMTLLWVVSIIIKNVSIVDLFWGPGFVVAATTYFLLTGGHTDRKAIVVVLTAMWGFRLGIHLALRNLGKGEDFRYREFRKKYGENRYWWVSFFQTFLLQGLLMWIISLPLLGAQYYSPDKAPGILDHVGILVWLTGFIFETGGDIQLTRFRSDISNKGKVLDTGFWRYTRHPNYFGDSAVWWGFMLISIAAGGYIAAIGGVIMTALIIKVSGVALLEKSLVDSKPQYRDYIERTSSFFPLPPKKKKNS